MSCLQAEAISPLANDHGACWSGIVGFNPHNRQTMEASWSGTVAFNPLIARTWGHAGQVPWYLTPLFARPWGMLVAYPGI
ncbi:hypothetical protein LIS32_004856 [Escherichia coli]|nr:hypothetical protein [Escherichia coli]